MSVLTFKSEEFKTFPAILREYATTTFSIKGCSEKTMCEYLLDLRTFFRYIRAVKNGIRADSPEFEEIDISDLEDAEIVSVMPTDIYSFLVAAATERKNNTSTRARKLSALKSFYGYIVKRKHMMETSPVAEIEGPKKKLAIPKYLSLEESISLLDAVRNDTESKTRKRDYCMITLFLNCGMRLSELVGINISDIDPLLRSMKVTGKGNKERIIYLNNACREAIQDYYTVRLSPETENIKNNALFLSTRDQRISNKTVQWVVYKYLRLAGLESKGMSVHKLRHTAATLMYQSGHVDVRVLKDILGHEQLNTTQIYTHIVNENMEQAMFSNPLSDISPGNGGKNKRGGKDDAE